jgi:polar amino acid transport system permease protein
MSRVVLPQALRVIIPPTGNEFIAMMKDTALVSLLGTPIAWADPFRRATLLGRADFRNLEALVVAAGWYWALTAVFTFFQRRLETKLSRGYVRQVAGAKGRPPGRFISASSAGAFGSGAMMVEVPGSDEPDEHGDGPG